MDNYTVYKHTSPSGKIYIGITRQRPETRWANGTGYKHSPHFQAAVQKYGWDNIRHEILAEGLSQEQAEQLEVELIAEYDSTNPAKGYNADLGGSTGPKHSAETRRKISAAVSGEKHPSYGKKQSAAWVAKRAAATKGHRVSPEHQAKLEASRKRSVKCLDTGETYESATDAGRRLNIHNSKITAVCRGRRKTAGGLRWKYQ